MTFQSTPDVFALTFTGSEHAVRDTLLRMRAWLDARSTPADTCGTAEIVLAEALNNIVEHAYPAEDAGGIDLSITHAPDRIAFEIRDRGAPLPDLALPKGARPSIDVDLADLPEGGFGWFMLRELTRDLGYCHADGENRLTFVIVPTA